MKNILLTALIIFSLSDYSAIAQASNFYFDIFVRKNGETDSANIDFFCCIPNKTLKFNRQANIYFADFNIVVAFTDSDKNITSNFELKGNAVAKSFEEEQGINGDFTLLTNSLELPPGNYRVRVLLRDNIANKEYVISRSISVVNYASFSFAISSILLLSSIEEDADDYIITPYLYDNVSFLNEGYFAFFEVYNDREYKQINITTEIRNENDKVIYNSGFSRDVDTGITQCYVKIPADVKYGLGNNTLRIFASEGISGVSGADSSVNILAAASRSIRYVSTMSDKIIKDLPKSIRQLKYVATDKQIDSINKAETDAEKLQLFEAFWKRLDPTPYTEKNEAMEEYYRRIDYANENFKAYQEGWLTDKGQVYVIFGAPRNIERSNQSFSDNRTFERWTYGNNRVIVFLDVSGFGDFRLHSPSFITDKYQFEF